jgi:hypothetical protein
MMAQAINMLLKFTAMKPNTVETIFSTNPITTSPAKKMRISVNMVKKMIAFIASSF